MANKKFSEMSPLRKAWFIFELIFLTVLVYIFILFLTGQLIS